MEHVVIYTDGACSGNPGPGGWCAIVERGGSEECLSGGEFATTNNRMELTAAIRALEHLDRPCKVDLYSDSKYVVDAMTLGWARKWRANFWRKPDKKPALNPDLWQRLLELSELHSLTCHWVKGHAANEKNNRCDTIAVAEARWFSALHVAEHTSAPRDYPL